MPSARGPDGARWGVYPDSPRFQVSPRAIRPHGRRPGPKRSSIARDATAAHPRTTSGVPERRGQVASGRRLAPGADGGGRSRPQPSSSQASSASPACQEAGGVREQAVALVVHVAGEIGERVPEQAARAQANRRVLEEGARTAPPGRPPRSAPRPPPGSRSGPSAGRRTTRSRRRAGRPPASGRPSGRSVRARRTPRTSRVRRVASASSVPPNARNWLVTGIRSAIWMRPHEYGRATGSAVLRSMAASRPRPPSRLPEGHLLRVEVLQGRRRRGAPRAAVARASSRAGRRHAGRTRGAPARSPPRPASRHPSPGRPATDARCGSSRVTSRDGLGAGADGATVAAVRRARGSRGTVETAATAAPRRGGGAGSPARTPPPRRRT